ncbi:branched-chain amino acid ABC transporter permease [Pseudorhodoferax sp.]|uniref:branched-chain amino acid ABC transporter permease n=1 Tax=Pseudorhodoferax sp. TaxID=1993553 RepID=UPI0039E488AB
MERFSARRLAILLAAGLALCLLPLVISGTVLPEITRIVVLAGVAMCLNLLVGTSGLISMGQGLFLGFGAYAVALGTLRYGLSYGQAALIAIALSLPLSLLVALISLRARHLFFGLLTMAIGQVAFVLVSRNYDLTGGDDGLFGIDPPTWAQSDLAQHYLAVAVLMVVSLILLRLLASPFGATLGAIRDNPDRVASLGGNPKLYEIAVMVIGGVLTTVFGVVWAATEGGVEPSLFSWVTSALLLMMVALGGRSIFLGPLLGVLILEVSRVYLHKYSSNSDLIVGALVIICAVFFPEGVGPAFQGFMRRSGAGKAAKEAA